MQSFNVYGVIMESRAPLCMAPWETGQGTTHSTIFCPADSSVSMYMRYYDYYCQLPSTYVAIKYLHSTSHVLQTELWPGQAIRRILDVFEKKLGHFR